MLMAEINGGSSLFSNFTKPSFVSFQIYFIQRASFTVSHYFIMPQFTGNTRIIPLTMIYDIH